MEHRVEEVFREEWSRAVAILTRVLGDLELAEDAVQDAFATALERWPAGRNAASAGRVDRHDRAQPRDRPHPARQGLPAEGRAHRTPAGASGRGGRRERDPGRAARPRLHLLSPGARRRRAASRSRCARSAASPPARSPARSSSRSRRWRSGSCARSGRSATRASRFAFRPTICFPSGSARFSRCSTSSSTRATRRRRAPISSAPTSATRRSGSESCSPCSCRTSPRCSACSRSCSCRTRGARRGFVQTARSCCSRTRIAASGTASGSTRASGCSTGPCRCVERGRTQLQAAIAAAHAEDRPKAEIVALYDALARIDPSPVVALNRAVAVALAGDVEGGLALLDERRGSRRATTSSTPRVPTCFDASIAATTPRRRIGERSSWRRTTRSADSSSDA